MAGDYTETWHIQKAAVQSAGGVVVAQHHRAARVGAEVLAAGGSAVDAAIATSLALGALEPWMSGIGGGGFMIVYRADKDRSYAIEAGMKASVELDPAAYPLAEGTGPDLFQWPAVVENRNINGPLSVAVPGLVAGLGLAARSFGTLSWSELVKPAIELADQGLAVDWFATLKIGSAAWDLTRDPTCKQTYLPHGFPPIAEWSGVIPYIRLGNLSETLSRLAQYGPGDFYQGGLAVDLIADATKLGIPLTRVDLAQYRAELTPIESFTYRTSRVDCATGMSAGPTLHRALSMLGQVFHPQGFAPDANAFLAYARCLVDAYEHRFAYVGDVPDGYAPPHTSHIGVVDADGNMVALTQTLLSIFGSKVMLPRTGVLMNNGVMWFDPRPGRPNSMAPGKRPLSNMCPALLKRADGQHFAIGAAGGRRIMPAVFQLISFLADYGMNSGDAAHHPRIDASGTPHVTVDSRLEAAIQDALASEHAIRVEHSGVYPNYFACPGIVCRRSDGLTEGAAFVMSPWAGAAAEV